MLPIKFLSLQKSELEYEVRIRGATAASSVEELRKQIVKLAKEYPSDHILISPLEAKQDLEGCMEVLTKIQLSLEAIDPSESSFMRAQNMLNHLHNRIERITCSDEIRKEYDEIFSWYNLLSNKLKTLQAKKSLPSTSPKISVTSAIDSASTDPNLQNLISVTCDRSLADLSKLKFNGNSCVRSFIQRVDEFIESRNIPSSRVLSFATEIFQEDALHWYRSVKNQVHSWPELAALLKQDFDQFDYEYRLISEIRSRTQGERENITIYLSIMNGMFSRLSKSLSEVDQLEILLHNIRPCYASTLASAGKIETIDNLRTLCRNYENIQARLSQFQEPPKVTSETLAPEFAYSKYGTKNNKQYLQYNNFNKHGNHKNQYQPHYNNNKNQQHYVQAIESKIQPYCPRCRNNSHHIRQCQAKRDIFCFKCGMKDVKTPDCPVCSKKPSASKN